MDTLTIELLCDHPDALPVLKDLLESEWESYYGVNGPGDAATDLKESANRTVLPIAVVALLDDKVCGTAALKMESVTTNKAYFPWLAGLLVAPPFRKRGIGERLIIFIETLAMQLDYKELYVGIGDKSGLSEHALDKRKWQFLRKSDDSISEALIYKKDL